MKVAIFASGNGSNFQVLAESLPAQAELALLFCDQPQAKVLARAQKLQVKTVCFSPKDFDNRQAYETQILAELKQAGIQWIFLAGYMRIIGETLLNAYPQRIVNIHPSLLPAFPGLHGIRDAFEAGVNETGVTVHYIDSGVDTGPIIAQERVTITEADTLATLETKIHQVEHRLYPQVVAALINKEEEA